MCFYGIWEAFLVGACNKFDQKGSMYLKQRLRGREARRRVPWGCGREIDGETEGENRGVVRAKFDFECLQREKKESGFPLT